ALAASLAPVRKPPADRQLLAADPPDAELSEVAARVDQAFREGWRLQGVAAAVRADDLTIARRLSLALVGMVPSLEELRQLEAEPAEAGLDRWLARLLADRRSHDYLAERLARALVGVQDGPFIIYRRRRFVSWLADQLAINRPYDEIVQDLIADSGLWTDHPATNFLTATGKPDPRNPDQIEPDPVELAARVSRAFLGVRLDCAECHDHPFEDWKQADFQGLAAFFGPTRQGLTGIHDTDAAYLVENRTTGDEETIAPRVPFQSELLSADGNARRRLAAWVTHRNNRAFGRAIVNRIWAQLFGRPLIEPVDDLHSADELPAAIDLLADDFVRHGYDLRRLIRAIAATEVFRLDSRTEAEQAAAPLEGAWAVFPLTRLRPEQVIGGVLQAASLHTIDYQSHILVRIARAAGQNDFIKRYGDSGEEEFAAQGETIPQRLLIMNGGQVQDRIKQNIVGNAATQIASLASSDAKAVETAYLCVLTRRPTPEEARHFERMLADTADQRTRAQRMEDLSWCLLNSTEFSWNH
ncbi:MAG TPA: DUF1549 domain-containing protein, partial [Pirellulales bacterium]|nr:DUF1549 domain-containing protein [Pirellulales bacterium]